MTQEVRLSTLVLEVDVLASPAQVDVSTLVLEADVYLDPAISISAPIATASASAGTPVRRQSGHAVLVTATGAALLPTVRTGARISAPTALATASAVIPDRVGGSLILAATQAAATAAALVPAVHGAARVSAPLATATGAALVPTLVTVVRVSVPTATATASAPVGLVLHNAHIVAPIARATAQPDPPLAVVRTSPSTFPALALLRAPSLLGSVFHEFVSQDGNAVHTRLGDWEANEEAPGGYAGATGVVSSALYRRHPEVFHFGTSWRTFLDDGECIWAGRLKEPLDGDGSARLTGTGRGMVAERDSHPALYQTYDLSLWSEIRPGRSLGVSQTTSWGISFTRNNLTSQAIAFVAPGQELRTVAFTFEAQGSAAEASTLLVSVAHAPEDLQLDPGHPKHPVVYEITIGGEDVNAPSPSTDPRKYTIDLTQYIDGFDVNTTPPYATPASYLRVPFKPTCIEIRVGDNLRGAAPSTAQEAHVRLDKLRVNAVAIGDYFSASDLVLDVAGKLGVAADIEPNGHNVLPLWIRAGETYGATLDHAALLTGWRWLLLDTGTRAYLDFGPYRKRGFRAIDTRATFDLEPGEIFNIIHVPVIYADDLTTDFVEIRADPDPLSGRRNVYTRLGDTEPYHNEDYARELGERLLRRLSRPKWGGSGRVVEVVEQGVRQSGHHIHAGDVLRTRAPRGSDSIGLRIGSLRRTEDAVELTFDAENRTVDRILQRRLRRKSIRKGTA